MYIPKPYFKNVPSMGDLQMDNIFLATDFPVLFTCRNNDRLFLCVCRTIIEEQKWVVSEIKFETLNKMINNQISIYDAFKSGVASCIVSWNNNDKKEKYRPIKSSDIDDSDLPDKDVMLDDDGDSNEYLKEVCNRLSIYDVSKQDYTFNKIVSHLGTFNFKFKVFNIQNNECLLDMNTIANLTLVS